MAELTITGIDWAWGQPSDEALDAAGVRFVCRYLSTADASKCITRAEADRHTAAGRGIVVVFENDARRMLAGRSAGIADATAADAQAAAAGLAGAPVYFPADWDATPAQQPMIDAYLGGCAAVLGRALVGAYGGFWPLSRIRAAGSAAYLWGTRAWSGNNWDTCGWQPHLMQGLQTSIGGVDCDWNVAYAEDYGQWKPPEAEDWQEEMMRALPLLKAGNAGGDVRTAQALLVARSRTLDVDGTFGPVTDRETRAFQAARKIAVDGTIGPDTWTELHRP